MINLLPDNYKSEVRAARMNVLLVRYIGILSAAIVVLGGIIVAAYIVLNDKETLAMTLVETNKVKIAPYEPIRQDAEALRATLSDAKTILDQKVAYSTLVYELADSMPQGVVLDTLDLDSSTFGSAMTINAKAKTFESASQLKDKLASNTEVFSDVKLLSLESASSGDTSDYPVRVSVSVVINKAALQ